MADQDRVLGAARAALGQGMGMGWGDEGEAWLRSKLGQGDYEDLVKKIRQEYSQYAEQNPKTSGALEFGGGMVPGLAMMGSSGTRPVGGVMAGRATLGALGRLGLQGAAFGSVAGAGSATENNRAAGAGSGAVMGGAFGVGLPLVMRGGNAALKWMRERLAPSEASIADRATGKMAAALEESGVKPSEIAEQMKTDVGMKVPSVVANANPALADLAEAVAQRSGGGARKVENTLMAQKLGARERAHQQTVSALQPGDYYADEQKLVQELRNKAGGMYDEAYAHGTVDDPKINAVLDQPAFKNFFAKAREIADTEGLAAKLRGEDPSKYALQDIYRPVQVGNAVGQELVKAPDVRTLDYIKRGIDATIDAGYGSTKSLSKAEANALKDLRKEFVKVLDENVPKYADARKSYAGDMEVIDALRSGMNDFGKMDHEQVINAIAKMSEAEKDAFRTGVARDMYSKIMTPSGNFNAAQRIIGSPEMQAKMQPLFDNPAHFELFKNAMERESQLFGQANKILGGSPTGKRLQMRENLESDSGVGDAIAHAVTGGFTSSLTGLAAKALRSGAMSEKTASKLADMLMAKDPNDVAAVVRTLEKYSEAAVPKAVRASAAESGVGSGAAISVFPPEQGQEKAAAPESIDAAPEFKTLKLGPGIDEEEMPD